MPGSISIHITDRDEPKVERIAGTPSIQIAYPNADPIWIHFQGRHNALKMMRAVQAVLDTWDRPPLPPEVEADEVPI
jgi:hypothetical protein